MASKDGGAAGLALVILVVILMAALCEEPNNAVNQAVPGNEGAEEQSR